MAVISRNVYSSIDYQQFLIEWKPPFYISRLVNEKKNNNNGPVIMYSYIYTDW